MDTAPTIEAMRTTAHTLRTGDVRDSLRAVQALQDSLDAAKSQLLAELDATKGFEVDGASTLGTWVRNQLHLKAGRATMLVRNITALRDLPLVGQAATAGLISAEHVSVFVYGLRHVGLAPIRDLQDVLVQVAKDHEPGQLFEAVKHLKDRVHPDDLDDAWERGMDREDFCVDAVPDGWHVTGFLNTVTGAKLKKVLDSVSAPKDKDDDRPGSVRRVQGLDDLLSDILGNGMPADKGVKPHLSVFVDAQTLHAAADRARQAADNPFLSPDPMPPVEPAVLAGHGAIGLNLLGYFACISDFTAFLMSNGTRQAQVLNAGTHQYRPTLTQRRAVLARQQGICATPGCHHTHLEIHHSIWWSRGGPTDLDLLIGICTRCHHLIHRGRLNITGNATNGWTFTTPTGRPLHRRRRTTYRPAA